jgi:hypothetical protein
MQQELQVHAADQPQVAERVDEAALPVNAPWCPVITDLVGAAVGRVSLA